MDENDQILEPSQSEVKPGSGSLLAAERKKQQQSVADIASQLNLSVAQIQAIESDQPDGLPEATYVRGYIRSYANLLGLNPDQILKSYLNIDWRKNSSLDDLPKGIGTANHGKSSGFSWGKFLGVLVLLGAAGFLYFSGVVSELLNSKEHSVAQTVNSSPALTVVSESDAIEVAGVNREAVETSSSSDSEVANTPVAASDDSLVSLNELTISFTETSWVDIRDEQDTRLAYQSYPKGEQLTVSSETPLSVFIGNAAGVTVEYNGAAFDITEFSQGVYAKFMVGE